MNKQLRFGAATFAALTLSCTAFAQDAAPAAAPVAATPVAVSAGTMLKLGTAVPLKLGKELDSRKTKTGERFDMTVAQDVVVDGRIAIPAGSVAQGEVSKVTKKGAFGRSGKIEARMLYVDVAGQRVPLTGQIDSAGKGGTTATVATAVVVGVFSAFVTGKSAVMPVGTEVTGYTAGEVVLTPGS